MANESTSLTLANQFVKQFQLKNNGDINCGQGVWQCHGCPISSNHHRYEGKIIFLKHFEFCVTQKQQQLKNLEKKENGGRRCWGIDTNEGGIHI